MGDHCKAARLVYQVDAAIHLDRVAVNMRWTTIGQEAIERLLPITHMPCLDQRVRICGRPTEGLSPTWATSASLTGTPSSASFARTPAGRPSRPSRTRAISAARPGLAGSAPYARTCTLLPRREQDSSIPRTTWTPSRSLPDCLIQAVEGVVISQPDDVQPDCTSLTHELSWRVRTVGDRGVSMEVDPHASDLSRCTEPH